MFMHTCVHAFELRMWRYSIYLPSTAPFCSRAKKYLLLSLTESAPNVTTFATGGPN